MMANPSAEYAESQALLPREGSQNSSPLGTEELWGYGYMVLSALFWSLLTFGIHISTTVFRVPVLLCIVVRGVVSLISAIFFICLIRPPRSMLTTASLLTLVARVLVGTIGCYCIFAAVEYQPLGEATTIFSTSPAITMLLSAALLSERITVVDIGAVVSTFIGVVFVTQPNFLFHRYQIDITSSTGRKFEHTDIGLAYALGAACCASTVYTLTRSLGTRIHFILNVIAISIGWSILPLVFTSADDLVGLFENRIGLLTVALSSLAGFGCVASFSRGLQLCRAGPAMVVRTLDIPFSFLLGFVFLSEAASFLKLIGVLMILAGSTAIGLREIVAPISREIQTPTSRL